MKRVTLATIKAFIRKNPDTLRIRYLSSFDGMTDGCEWSKDRTFQPVVYRDPSNHTLGITGVWFVGRSRDYFSPINEPGFVGFHVYNCCGSFDLAVRS